ncbi:alpha/beta hydrolase [Thalassotalea ponticola]|uniref:alpha/beta hydrolase n=1 Tax=Thalassotalea ponticola TaxID=1523392 RepID=UPI0025B5D3DC|nr:alpha/beta hydrolase [Thalassotalea ponticola]MDN3653339.1 alpha/beta hydrolase [Thalassotalea ponticola]
MGYRQFTSQQLAQQYSPSSCIDDINVFLQDYRKSSEQALLWAQQQGRIEANVAYGSDEDERLDLYLPTAKPSGKLQVYIHGGYWQQLGKQDSAFAANAFQQLGCHFAVINYSLAPKVSLSAIVEQNRKAIVWLYQHAERFGYDRQQIYISGSSAGAHLAMLMAQTNWQQYGLEEQQVIRGVCAVSGIYDLEPIAQTYINEPLHLTADEIDTLSPMHLPLPNQCPVIIAYGDNETAEFKRQSDDMAARLNTASMVIADRNHFNVVMELGNVNSPLCQAVIEQMMVT